MSNKADTDKRKTHVLIILDGWGHRTNTDSNAIAQANTPTWDKLLNSRPHTFISGSGFDVGLPEGQMGNSEVGHMNLGAGRVVDQDFTRITKSINDTSFFSNPVLTEAIAKAKARDGAIHLFGLLSPGGVHSHEDHIKAAVQMAFSQGAKAVYMHAFLDGRDVPPKSAKESLVSMDQYIKQIGKGGIASIVGRFYAMDRDNRWDRVEAAYNMLVKGTSEFTFPNVTEALEAAYERDETDEFVKPTIISETAEASLVSDGDAVLFMNFRADRAREISRAFLESDFQGFDRSRQPDLADFVSLTRYADDLTASCAFSPEGLPMVLGEYLASLNKTQLRIAETEKYAHVTFFFSGGRESTFAGEQRILIPSPDVKTYDLKPEMSAFELTDSLAEAITSGEYDAIICNFANGDMVGHTGKMSAAIKAVETVDACLARITEALDNAGGEGFITADHGNVEQMLDPKTGQPHTAHTSELVPFVYLGHRKISMRSGGTLSDVAPSLLRLMNLPQPEAMTGCSIINLEDEIAGSTANAK
jgi:2,3-bisphosphoglycerate-independent phosphoglycerate mutase